MVKQVSIIWLTIVAAGCAAPIAQVPAPIVLVFADGPTVPPVIVAAPDNPGAIVQHPAVSSTVEGTSKE